MARPKKIKVAVVIIIVMGIANQNLANNITDSVEESAACRLMEGMQIFDGMDDGANWSSAQQDVYDAMEAIADAYAGTTEFDLEVLSDYLQEALDNL